jgi:hypothetical protein
MDTEYYDNEEMNIKNALDILNISLNQIELSNITQEYLKKQYHRMALKWHPDKNGNSDIAKKYFQKINEAYEYLSVELSILDGDNLNTSFGFVSSSDSKESKFMYTSLLTKYLSILFKGDYNELVIEIIKEIIIGCNVVSVKMFEDLDKHKAIELYYLLCKYKDVFYISEETLELVSSIIKEKYKNDKVFILRPSIKDLFENNIYKLYVDEQFYLVPLWHNELYFDSPDGSEIIVLCNPSLPNDLTIDEDNNIYITKDIKCDASLLKMIMNDEPICFEILNKKYFIPISKLYMKKKQNYILKGKGISKIIEKDIYNVSIKSDIIIEINLI